MYLVALYWGDPIHIEKTLSKIKRGVSNNYDFFLDDVSKPERFGSYFKKNKNDGETLKILKNIFDPEAKLLEFKISIYKNKSILFENQKRILVNKIYEHILEKVKVKVDMDLDLINNFNKNDYILEFRDDLMHNYIPYGIMGVYKYWHNFRTSKVQREITLYHSNHIKRMEFRNKQKIEDVLYVKLGNKWLFARKEFKVLTSDKFPGRERPWELDIMQCYWTRFIYYSKNNFESNPNYLNEIRSNRDISRPFNHEATAKLNIM